jgi:hypothetical protein
MIVTFYIQPQTLPRYLPLKVMTAALESAFRYIETKAAFQVKFQEVSQDALPNLYFTFGGLPLTSNAHYEKMGAGRYRIRFNTSFKWAARSGLGVLRDWIRGRQQNLRTIAIHEVLHCLGLRDHSDDPGSVMYSHPVFPHILDNDQLLLLVVTRREFLL